ncbi:MAG TPA: RNA polymerase sigma factor [Tepidisphaeraceae bacterium]|nr:RNA polymerase sigma factor [Tepidisphaeraceae bacterium]
MFDSIADLTLAMSRGDRAAVEAFYRRYFDWMYRVAGSATRRDESFCLDIVHDAVIRVVRVVRPMQTQAHFENWLRLVVRTCALDRLRADARRTKREATRVPTMTHAEPALDQADVLTAALARLDPEIVRLIELRYAHGLTLARMALLLNTTTGAIDGRLRRAIALIRQDWSDHETA